MLLGRNRGSELLKGSEPLFSHQPGMEYSIANYLTKQARSSRLIARSFLNCIYETTPPFIRHHHRFYFLQGK